MSINKLLKQSIKNILIIIGVIIIGLLLRILVIEIYYIPSSSMENTLFEGDIILVNKLHYGAKIPFSHSKRTFGYSDIERRDVFVFEEESNSIFTNSKVFIKRCVGLPSDKIDIISDQVFINNIKEESSLLKINLGKNHSQLSRFDELNEHFFNNKQTSRKIPYSGMTLKIDSLNIESYRKVFYRDSKAQNPSDLLNRNYKSSMTFIL